MAMAAVLGGGMLAHSSVLEAPERVSFATQDGGLVYADMNGKGDHGVVLAHGGRFNKESWEKQARALAAAGFRVLAIDFRGYGQSRGPGQSDPVSAPLHFDVLAAVRYLKETGAKTVSVVGASMGGVAAADASIEAGSGEIDALCCLAAWRAARQRSSRGANYSSRPATTLPRVAHRGWSGFGRSTRECQSRKLVILEGSAHAQFLFQTAQGERLMSEILRFLSAP
ncbi:MAG: alpha/beta hydrolase [Terriglobales bacterium]